jgi:L-ascorbate metabolism protein UlaG (beta-lactamase superfamily)
MWKRLSTKNIIMVLLLSNREEVQKSKRSDGAARYPALIRNVISEWSSSEVGDMGWLMYSANYLLRTGGIRWAIDPMFMNWRVPETPPVEPASLAEKLEFVLLTHEHADHLDLNLLRNLRNHPITWIVPEEMQAVVVGKGGISKDRIINPVPMKTVMIKGIQITPFESLHWEPPPPGKIEPHGVPEIGYLVEFNGKRWLFPGDIRDYRVDLLPKVGEIDVLFMHLWLGRKCALVENPPFVKEFCEFCADLKPKKVTLAHLDEYGRPADNLWDAHHAGLVISQFSQTSPGIPMDPFHTGERVSI